MRSPCTTLLREDRLRFGKEKLKNYVFTFLCARLALLCFAKIGCGSAKKNKNCLFCFSLRSPCTTLLREDRLRLGKEKQKLPILFFSALTLHYLCTRNQKNNPLWTITIRKIATIDRARGYTYVV